jgi:large subunit ribosomal protein L22
MATASAQLSDYRQAPRKVRVVANLVRGKRVEDAMTSLRFLGKRASDPILKLIESAVSNAKNKNIEIENLIVKEIRVDSGKILYRRMSASRGRAPIKRKRTSHVIVVLGEGKPKKTKVKKENK